MKTGNKINYKHAVLLTIVIMSLSIAVCDGGGGGSDLPLNSKVIMIGDSYFAKNEYVPAYLSSLSGEQYRHYYISGSELNDTSYDAIPSQYERAVQENPDIRTVIMIGGGNDILNDPNKYCWAGVDPPNSNCQSLIDSVFDKGQSLIDTMEADGVENVVFLFYPHLVYTTYFDYTIFNPAIDYSYDQFINITATNLNYFLVDSRTDFEGRSEYFIAYDFHPNQAGGNVLAQLIWSIMVSNGIEQ